MTTETDVATLREAAEYLRGTGDPSAQKLGGRVDDVADGLDAERDDDEFTARVERAEAVANATRLVAKRHKNYGSTDDMVDSALRAAVRLTSFVHTGRIGPEDAT
jgi:hypothetical protein